MKTIKSNFAVICSDTITLLDERKPIYPLNQELLKDVTINFIENGCIEITGDIILFKFIFDGFFVNGNAKFSDEEITQKFNLFKLKRMPYIKSGWREMKETKRITMIKNKYEVIQ